MLVVTSWCNSYVEHPPRNWQGFECDAWKVFSCLCACPFHTVAPASFIVPESRSTSLRAFWILKIWYDREHVLPLRNPVTSYPARRYLFPGFIVYGVCFITTDHGHCSPLGSCAFTAVINAKLFYVSSVCSSYIHWSIAIAQWPVNASIIFALFIRNTTRFLRIEI